MSNIIQFTPKTEVHARENLSEFVRLCKEKLTVFNNDEQTVNWDDYVWKAVVNFTKLGTHSRSHTKADALDKNFIDFAKYYFRYQQGIRPTGTKSEVKAIACIEKALLDAGRKAEITVLDEDVLDSAAEIARAHYMKGSAYQAGRELARLGSFVSENHICLNAIDWTNPNMRAADKNKTGKKAKQEREEKLPEQDGIDAIAEIYANNPSGHRDVFTTSSFALMMCVPSRGTEILELPVYCDDIPVEFVTLINKEGKKNTGYGWRFKAGKGYDPEIKWLPTIMQDLGRDAVQRIRDITQSARGFAKSLEENPDKFPRHPMCPDVDEQEPLTFVQAAYALGYSHDSLNNPTRRQIRSGCVTILRNRNIPREDGVHTLESLLPVLKARLPKDWPWLNKAKDLKYSDALYCMFANQLDSKKSTITVELWAPHIDTLNEDLGVNMAKPSIFDRWGYNDGRENPLRINSHSPRHLLNTHAQRRGLSQVEIAKWSGRADIKQNAVYNHVSPEEVFEEIRRRDSKLTLFGPDCFEISQPTSITEFNSMERAPVHVTEFGYCEHDYVMSNCSKFRDCTNCDEEVCIKGDEEALVRMQEYSGRLKVVVARDEKALSNGEIGKEDQSYVHNKITLQRLNAKIELLESEDLPKGSLIKLANEYSITPYERAMISRKAKGLAVDTKVETHAILDQKKKIIRIKKMFGDDFG